LLLRSLVPLAIVWALERFPIDCVG
jgi:hypothetical protein